MDTLECIATRRSIRKFLDIPVEFEKIGNIRVAIIDPGATRTDMRAKAYPGEDPETVKQPDVVAERLVGLLGEDFTTGHRERIDS